MVKNRQTPECIGIILDGNRRWVRGKGLSLFEGHRVGAERLRDLARWTRDRGVKHLAVFIFSTENWSRSKDEVSYLLKLFQNVVDEWYAKITEENIRIKFVGERGRFDKTIQETMTRIEKKSEKNNGLTLWTCFSYGGRREIAAAACAAAAEGPITEDAISEHLWTVGMPDPDLIIRTGGEKRLSGFLTWQGIYSELFFVDEYWPDFSEDILDSILAEYAKRERRIGK